MKEPITHTATVTTHKINCLAAAMIRRSRACAVPDAEQLSNSTRKSVYNGLGPVTGNCLAARARRWNGWVIVATKACSTAGAALELHRTGTLIRHHATCTVALPPAVSGGAVCTRGLGATFDIHGVPRACPRDVGVAATRTGRST